MAGKEKQEYLININLDVSYEFFVKAKNEREAKKIAWKRYSRKKKIRKDHSIY